MQPANERNGRECIYRDWNECALGSRRARAELTWHVLGTSQGLLSKPPAGQEIRESHGGTDGRMNETNAEAGTGMAICRLPSVSSKENRCCVEIICQMLNWVLGLCLAGPEDANACPYQTKDAIQ